LAFASTAGSFPCKTRGFIKAIKTGCFRQDRSLPHLHWLLQADPFFCEGTALIYDLYIHFKIHSLSIRAYHHNPPVWLQRVALATCFGALPVSTNSSLPALLVVYLNLLVSDVVKCHRCFFISGDMYHHYLIRVADKGFPLVSNPINRICYSSNALAFEDQGRGNILQAWYPYN
jgi:hypothetical protein